GPERGHLEALIAELGLEGRVLLPGYARNAFAIVSRATLFAAASNAEGFPNALVEAMGLSVPVVATDCDSGPAEILGRGTAQKVTDVSEAQWGLLTPTNDEAAMARALMLMQRDDKRTHYAGRALKRAQDFSVKQAIDAYAREIQCALGANAAPR